MAKHQTMNIDTIRYPEKFQELCHALLMRYFGPELIPCGSLGKDMGLDAILEQTPSVPCKFEGVPKVYAHTKFKKNGTWVFQMKFHTTYDGRIPQTVTKDMKNEIADWNKRGDIPENFIYITNMVFPPKARKYFKDLNKDKKKIFHYVDFWDGAKIHAMLTCNDDIRRVFFPNCEDRIDGLAIEIKKLTPPLPKGEKGKNKRASGTTVSDKTLKPKSKASELKTTVKTIEDKIKSLVKIEYDFTQLNEKIYQRIKIGESVKPGKDWKKIKVNAKKSGLIQLTPSSYESINLLIDGIKRNSIKLIHWSKFFSETIKAGEEIISFEYREGLEEVIQTISDNFATIGEEENTIHDSIDKELNEIVDHITSSLSSSKFATFNTYLTKFQSLKNKYLDLKYEIGEGSYPNVRRFGSITFGWDFSSKWLEHYKTICSLAVDDKLPEEMYSQLFYSPFWAVSSLIRNYGNEDRLRDELNICQYLINLTSDPRINAPFDFEDKIENFILDFNDSRYQVKTKDNLESILKIAKVLCNFLDSKVRNEIDASPDADIATTINFLNIIGSYNASDTDFANQPQEWEENRKVIADFQNDIRLMSVESKFAYATYSLYLARTENNKWLSLAKELINQVKLDDIVYFYNNLRKMRNWYQWWFTPKGKRVSWSSSFDHDIREAFLFKLLNSDFNPEDIVSLSIFETSPDFEKIKNELNSLAELVSEKMVSDVSLLISKMQQSYNLAHKEQLDKIRKANHFDKQKLEEIDKDFVEELNVANMENILYKVEVVPDLKSERYVGTYTLYDKDWFLEDTPHVSRSVHSMGANWADIIMRGREYLLGEYIKNNFQLYEVSETELDKIIEEMKQNIKSDFVIIKHPYSFPHMLWQKHFSPPKDQSIKRIHGKLAEANVLTVNSIDRWTFCIYPKSAFTWATNSLCTKPRIETIDPLSDIGKKIKEKNPTIDTDLKVIVAAKENGEIRFNEEYLKEVKFYKLRKNKNDEDN
jgi:hypothetical protein